jgi:hypothetical protein
MPFKDIQSRRAYQRYYQNKFAKKYVQVTNEKKSIPCYDCGEEYPPYVMDFDHRPGTVKSFNIAKERHSISTLLTEIDKCDVVCSNCHRQRTHQRRLDA